jgi:hypothetical protein
MALSRAVLSICPFPLCMRNDVNSVSQISPISVFSSAFHRSSHSVTGLEGGKPQKFGESEVGAAITIVASPSGGFLLAYERLLQRL